MGEGGGGGGGEFDRDHTLTLREVGQELDWRKKLTFGNLFWLQQELASLLTFT